MQTIIRFRNRQIFTQEPNGSWNLKSKGLDLNLSEALKNGHKVQFAGPLTTIDLYAMHAPVFTVRSVYRPNNDVVFFESEEEVNELIEKLIRENRKCLIEFVA